MKLSTLMACLMLFITACDQAPTPYPDTKDVIGYIEPLQLNVDSTTLYLHDFFTDPSKIDSITTIENGLKIQRESDDILILSNESAPPFSLLNCWIDGVSWMIPVKKSKLRQYTFSFNTRGRSYNSVQMKGEMNAWNVNAQELIEQDGIYSADMLVEAKDYQYIMVLDGKETLDFNNEVSVSNGMGGFNSVLSPFGKVKDEAFSIRTNSYENSVIIIEASAIPDRLFALYNNFGLSSDLVDGNILITVPEAAKKMKRSHIRVYASKGEVLSNDLLIPLEYGVPVQSVDELDRTDKHAMSLYNIFVDRFYNGDTTNDRPLNLPDVHPRADDHGGDIRGAIDKVEAGYFKELGINTIWISPIVKNVEGPYGLWPEPKTRFSAYHGYWPISFTLIDDRKGTAEELHELVRVAHENNMNILLDFVANHVHEEHPWYKANKDLATDLYLPDGRLNTELWDEQRLTTWFDVFLPSLKLDVPEVYEMLTDSAVYWIKEYNLDGFRHDATKHVPEIFWRTLTRKLKDEVVIPENRPLYQIGETYGTRELVGSYINSGQLDAQFDFNVYDATLSCLADIKEGSFEKFNKAIEASLNMFGHHHLMGNITGNQDKGRFISYAGGALKFSENAKVAGWSREILVGDPIAYKKSELLMGLIATIPGLPVIYNGDEIGSYGGNDPDNRKMMKFEGLTDDEQGVKDMAAKVFKVRNNDLALIYGDYRLHQADEDTYIFSRNYFDNHSIVIFNKSNDEVEFEIALDEGQAGEEIKTAMGSSFTLQDGGVITLTLPSNSFDIIQIK